MRNFIVNLVNETCFSEEIDCEKFIAHIEAFVAHLTRFLAQSKAFIAQTRLID